MLAEIFQHARTIIQHGGIIAYPTEAVYGLGCDPQNEKAVQKILTLKDRALDKGLIVIAANWQQIEYLAQALPMTAQLQAVFNTWPGPYTWLFPASALAPRWITGAHDSIALRVTAHPEAKQLCEICGPLVSTSANYTGELPCKTFQEVKAHFGDTIDYIVPGMTGNLQQPTPIRDVLTGKIIRS